MDYTQLFFQAFIYLSATVVAVPIAKRIGLGSVLGYIIAGIVIGPYVLGLVDEHITSVMHIAEFGVVMMLFIIGLELRPTMLWELRQPILVTGGLQVVITTLVITLIGKLFNLDTVSALVIGMIFALSSTAIVLQMLNEKGWIKLDAGNTIFAVLLFQDIAIIPMLAIFPLLGGKSTTIDNGITGIEQTLLIVGLIVIIIISGRYLLRPIFRFIASSQLHEAFTALALLLVIGISLAMQYVGLSPALGAFLAGVVLAESEYRHELEADIKPFKGLLLGLFFISVGSTINFPVIFQHLVLIISLVIILVLVKCIVLFILGKLFRKPLRDNLMMAMTLAQGGEFCFVLLSFALQEGILSEELTRELVAVVALSMLITPLIMLIYEKIIEPRLTKTIDNGESDVIEQSNPVIIAGFGRFGQVVGRFMLANGIGTTVLDIDVNQVEVVRKFGFKVFYGDASRIEVLNTAGLGSAQVLVLAIDNSETALQIVEMVRKQYPEIKILLRVRSRTHVYDALNKGVLFADIYRETFESALLMASGTLQALGIDTKKAHCSMQRFKKIDQENLLKMLSFYDGQMNEDYISEARAHNKELENILTTDKTITIDEERE